MSNQCMNTDKVMASKSRTNYFMSSALSSILRSDLWNPMNPADIYKQQITGDPSFYPRSEFHLSLYRKLLKACHLQSIHTGQYYFTKLII